MKYKTKDKEKTRKEQTQTERKEEISKKDTICNMK